MEKIEILKELKIAYEHLLDIKEHTSSINNRHSMDIAINEIGDVYTNTYKELAEQNGRKNIEVVNPITKNKYILSPIVECDYFDESTHTHYACGDVDFYWYQHDYKEIYPEKMEVLFTFGSWEGYPYQNGYIIIKAYTLQDAIAEFRTHYPDIHKNTLCCADYYCKPSSVSEIKQLYGDDKCFEVFDATESSYKSFNYQAEINKQDREQAEFNHQTFIVAEDLYNETHDNKWYELSDDEKADFYNSHYEEITAIVINNNHNEVNMEHDEPEIERE